MSLTEWNVILGLITLVGMIAGALWLRYWVGKPPKKKPGSKSRRKWTGPRVEGWFTTPQNTRRRVIEEYLGSVAAFRYKRK